jgi:tetratricopeptide (TPR) repeat protein/TolB-like protein
MIVLPFRSVGPSLSNGELGRDLAAELTSRFGTASSVILRPSPAALDDRAPDPIQAGRDAKADWVLDGTLREDPGRTAYSVRLLATRDGGALWSQDFESGPDDFVSGASTISIGLAEALAPQISAHDREALEEPHAQHLDAYRLVMKGRLAMSRGGKGVMEAGDYFELAIQKDPHYAPAYASLASCYTTLFDNLVIAFGEGAADARRNALKAVELDGVSADAHLSLALVHSRFDWDWTGADREYRRAIELGPNEASVHVGLGYFDNELGRFDDALQELRTARTLDAESPWIPTLIGETLRRAGRSDEAIEELRRAIAMDPELGTPHYKLGLVYEERGMYETAIAEFLRCLDAYGISTTAAAIRKANEAGGAMGAYRAWLERCEIDRNVKAVRIAQIEEVLGRRDRALEALETGLVERSAGIYEIGTEPTLSKLRSEPRFQELLRRMNVPTRSF